MDTFLITPEALAGAIARGLGSQRADELAARILGVLRGLTEAAQEPDNSAASRVAANMRAYLQNGITPDPGKLLAWHDELYQASRTEIREAVHVS
jgi:hypothetical protein